MTEQNSAPTDNLRKLSLFKRVAHTVLAVEDWWGRLWPAAMLVGVYLALSLLNIWQAMPVWLHASGLLILFLSLIAALWRAFSGARPSSPRSTIARLEADSGIAEHSLDSLDDRLADDSNNILTQALWRREQQRAQDLLKRLQIGLPRSPLPRRDPWALRAAVLLILVVALIDGGDRIGIRLARSLDLQRATTTAAVSEPSARFWVTPPSYTGLAPRQLDPGDATVTVPAGSEALLQIQGLSREQDTQLHASLDEQPLDWTGLGSGGAEIRTTLDAGGLLEIGDGGALFAQWRIELIADQPPSITFAEDPEQTIRGVLRIALEAADDYGVVETVLVVDSPYLTEPFRLSLHKPRPQATKIESTKYLDLTANKLAGLETTLRLEAVDAIGQIGQSEPIETRLPERPFAHPLAQAMIAARKQLVSNPGGGLDVAKVLRELARDRMAQSFGTTVPFALGMAASRLGVDQTPEGRDSVIDLLWEIALFVEDGALSMAERQLRDLQDRLSQALENGTELDELEDMLAELQEALDQFLDEMTRQAMERMRQNDPDQNAPQQLPPDAQIVDQQDLQDMLDQIREMMRQGMREQAMEMMAQLREMLENMQTEMAQQTEPSPGEQALQDLQQMLQAQQNLLDRTHRLGQQGEQMQGDQSQPDGQEGQDGPQSAPDLAMEQDVLRQALNELMRRLGEAGMPIPRPLGQAELQMRDARDALDGGQPGSATGLQSNAIDLMQQGGQALLEQMREQMANQQGMGMRDPKAQRQGRDPLGRPQRNDGGAASFGTEIPAENDLGRARSVLEELQRRSGERGRPARELDYIERLLDRF